MTVGNELIDSLLADYKTPEDLIGDNCLLKLPTKKLVERETAGEGVHDHRHVDEKHGTPPKAIQQHVPEDWAECTANY